VSAIGLVSLLSRMRAVNAGAFVFPLLITLWAFLKYRKALTK